MTPEQISILTALVSVLKTFSSWPFGIFVFCIVIGPWLMAIFITHNQSNTHKKRFEEVVDMYESNVRLVEKYEAVAKDLRDVVIMNTQGWQKATDAIDKNQFCPVVRGDVKINLREG